MRERSGAIGDSFFKERCGYLVVFELSMVSWEDPIPSEDKTMCWKFKETMT